MKLVAPKTIEPTLVTANPAQVRAAGSLKPAAKAATKRPPDSLGTAAVIGPKFSTQLQVAPADAKLLAARQTANDTTVLASRLESIAPGGIAATPRARFHFKWPDSPAAAVEALKNDGYVVVESAGDTITFRKTQTPHAPLLSLTTMNIANTDGYVVSVGSACRHAQLGELSFAPSHWRAFSDGYTKAIEGYNRLLERPERLNRSPSPRDDSELHGPQDGLKHLLRLGRPLKNLTARREKLQQLSALRSLADGELARAKSEGRAPKHIAILVEGLDGASKTGNGLSLSRIAEEAGYAPKMKAFRGPSEEELAAVATLGPMARYKMFVDPKSATVPTVWLLDRAHPGDFVHNPKSSLSEIAAAADVWEKELAADGVMVLKFIFEPSAKASMKTFGKRLARAKIAADMLKRRTDLTPDDHGALAGAAALVPGFNDFRSVANAKDSARRYHKFASANDAEGKWAQIKTANRHRGRVETLKVFAKRLTRYQPPKSLAAG